MRLSHSKLNNIMNCPMSYYLSYEKKIHLKCEKPALSIGSAVHWGIEHDTNDLSQYYLEQGTFRSRNSYTYDQILSEAMVYGFQKHKDEIYEQLLSTGEEELELIEESKEIYLSANLPSKLGEHHTFVGIIDLLLLTNKGFIVVDYKTSSSIPDYSKYLEQIYRYIFLLKENFPEVPIVKIGIINLKKTRIRQKKTENIDEFFIRLKQEYELNDENHVDYYEYTSDLLEVNKFNDYISNLSMMADTAQTIIDNKLFFINFSNAQGIYGKSDYWNIFYKIEDSEYFYEIEDYVYDEDDEEFKTKRDCFDIDLKCVDLKLNILNNFEIYKKEREIFFKTNIDSREEDFVKTLKTSYITNDSLLKIYKKTFEKLI